MHSSRNCTLKMANIFFVLCIYLVSYPLTIKTKDLVFGQEIKYAISEISDHIKEAIKSYALAVGEKYLEAEISSLDVNASLIAKYTGSQGKLVDDFSYTSSRNHLKTGELLFIDLIHLIKSSSCDDVIKVQSGLLMLQNLFDSKSSYNIIEDVGFGIVINHLENIYKQA